MGSKMNAETNALNWFEIPAKDIARAKRMYEAILEIQMQEMEMIGMKMVLFPSNPELGKASGALVQSDMHVPSQEGSIIYLNANPDLQLVLSRVEKSGGKILMPKTLIDENTGYMAFILDSEGNKIGLHSNK